MSIANFLKITIKTIKKAYFLLLFNKAKYAYIGAGDGNRTHLSSLGSSHSTDELHLRFSVILIYITPKKSIPKTAEISINKIADGAFFVIFLYVK